MNSKQKKRAQLACKVRKLNNSAPGFKPAPGSGKKITIGKVKQMILERQYRQGDFAFNDG